jgi:hypothetical protein
MNMTEVVEVYLARQRSLGMRFEAAERMLHRFAVPWAIPRSA